MKTPKSQHTPSGGSGDDLFGFLPGEIVEAASDITAGLGVARMICDAGTELRVTGPSGNLLHPIRVEKTDGSSWACAVSSSDIRKPNAKLIEVRLAVDEHADLLYSVYCEAVGGVAFNGDTLPAWADFAADPSKQKQADAWRSVAKQSPLGGAACSLEKIELPKMMININTLHKASHGWQAMETSPRKGVVFLAFVPHDQGGFAFAAVWNTAERLICMMGGDDFTGTATHWMLLPEFPENAKERQPPVAAAATCSPRLGESMVNPIYAACPDCKTKYIGPCCPRCQDIAELAENAKAFGLKSAETDRYENI